MEIMEQIFAILFHSTIPYSGVRRKKFRGRVQGYGRLVVGAGGGAPSGRRRIFENLQKTLRKLQKMKFFSSILQINSRSRVKSCAFGRNSQMGGKF